MIVLKVENGLAVCQDEHGPERMMFLLSQLSFTNSVQDEEKPGSISDTTHYNNAATSMKPTKISGLTSTNPPFSDIPISSTDLDTSPKRTADTQKHTTTAANEGTQVSSGSSSSVLKSTKSKSSPVHENNSNVLDLETNGGTSVNKRKKKSGTKGGLTADASPTKKNKKSQAKQSESEQSKA